VVLVAACAGSDRAAPEAESSESTATSVPATAAPPTTPTSTTVPDATAPTTTTPTITDPPAPTTTAPPPAVPTAEELNTYEWTEVNTAAPWAARAGLRVIELDGRLLVLGGRTPNESTTPGDSRIWADVWASDDLGATWTPLQTGEDEAGSFPPRAYFQAVVKDETAYVIGGQDFGLEENPFCALLEQGVEPPPFLGIDPDAPCPEFLATSQFFDDVWSSTDGATWTEVTGDAPWDGRAGLSAAVLGDHMYVMAGSTNDDSSIIGPDGPSRIYYDDVWRSIDGQEWELVTEHAPWEPRAGAAVVVRDDRLFLLGGEYGFTCSPLPDCDAPYFNDVWSTTDGENWELLTAAAGWSSRPGHVCMLLGTQIVCFGGFGLITNPTDVWASVDGVGWTLLDAPPWNAAGPEDGKYDFDAITIADADGDDVIVTVGGDRETFDFTDPDNFLRVDNDVWMFSAP
jgi:hypothetical protein